MIKVYNPKRTPEWMEYSGLVVGIMLIVWGILNNIFIVLILGLCFILILSHKLQMFIIPEGLLMKTTTLYCLKRRETLNFKEINSIEIKKGKEKSMVIFWKNYRGRRVLINNRDLNKLFDYIAKKNPALLKSDYQN